MGRLYIYLHQNHSNEPCKYTSPMEAMSMCIYKNKNMYYSTMQTKHYYNKVRTWRNQPYLKFKDLLPKCAKQHVFFVFTFSSVFSWLMTCSDTDVKRHLRVVVKHAEKKTCLVRLEFWKNTGESFEKWRWRTMKTHTTWGHLLGCEPWYYQTNRFGIGKDYHITYIWTQICTKGIECEKQQQK